LKTAKLAGKNNIQNGAKNLGRLRGETEKAGKRKLKRNVISMLQGFRRRLWRSTRTQVAMRHTTKKCGGHYDDAEVSEKNPGDPPDAAPRIQIFGLLNTSATLHFNRFKRCSRVVSVTF
jgi:hypothetical protein